MKRRTFIRNSTAALAGVSMLNTGMISGRRFMSEDIGIILYTLARPLSDDFPGTIKKLAEFGYKNIQFSGPFYFSSEEERKNNPLVTMMGLTGFGYFDRTPKEIRIMLDDLGLYSNSAHVSDASMEHNMDEAIDAANIIGQKFILSPMFMGQSLDDYKKAAERYNVFGEKCKSAGIQYGYHTHSHEFGEYEGVSPFEVFMKNTDPGLVTFELDLFWATVAGVDPVELIKKYPGRIKILHIKEMAQKLDRAYNTNEPFTNMEIGMKIFQNQTIIGEGVIDFNRILSEAKGSGIEHLIIESDFPQDPVKFAQQSILNLKKIVSKI